MKSGILLAFALAVGVVREVPSEGDVRLKSHTTN